MTDTVQSPQTLVQRALAGHAAIGLIVGAAMYLICLSGALVVIHERWQRWEQPQIAETPTIAPEAVQRGLEAVLAAQGKPTTHLYVHMPTESLPRTVVTTDHGASYIDAEGRIVGREAHSFTEFLVNLHIYLHLPMTLGLIIVGALGAMLAALCISGVMAHPRIFRDAFRLRPRAHRQLAHGDWHNRLGVWTLPFGLALALTGAIIGLALVGAQLIANQHHGGDIEAAYAPIFGDEGKPDPRAAPVADVVPALQAMAAGRPDATPTYVTIHDPGTAGQHVAILADIPRRLIYGETFNFDGAGRYQGRVGLSDGPLGRQAAASIYKLHFGSFGGLPVEIAYIAIGLALSVVSATGVTLWLVKRRRKGLASPRLEAGWAVIVWGSPILMVATLWLRAVAGPDAPLVGFFWIALALALTAAMARPFADLPRLLRLALAAMLTATAIGHALLLGPMPGEVFAIDLALAVTAGVLWLASRGGRREVSAIPLAARPA